MSPHDDLSCEELGRFVLQELAAAALALVFIAWLLWTLSAAPSPSLIGTGATAPLGDTAPVPAFSQEMR